MVVAVAVVVGPLLVTQPAYAATTANLVKNPGAEAAPGSTDGSVVAVPKWIATNGASFTAVKYGSTGFPSNSSPGPSNRGHNFFAGGPNDENSSIVATQTISLSTFKTAIKDGSVKFALSAYLGGVGSDPDQALVELDFKNAQGFLIGQSTTLAAVTAANRNNVTGLLRRTAKGKVPKGARSIYLQLIFDRIDGSYNNALADNVSVTLSGV